MCAQAPAGAKVIVQNVQTVEMFEELFYAPVSVNNKFFNEGNAWYGVHGLDPRPKCLYEGELKIYRESCLIPVLVIPGQQDDLIIGTNVIKFLSHRMKGIDDYWRLISSHTLESPAECKWFLDVMANTCRWKDS